MGTRRTVTTLMPDQPPRGHAHGPGPADDGRAVALGTALNRRAVLKTISLGVVGIVITACGGKRGGTAPSAGSPGTDFSARFAAYEPAPEPDGDLSKVVWPAFVTRAGPDVQRLYAFQIENGELMRYMPCFCGCAAQGHTSNFDCYVAEELADGSVLLDPMSFG